ncbi:MAG: hypothetical protein M0R47_01360 [Methylobacter sp.]|uniref:major coat protein n=1 Tax=Methylobacter sp. TaxID=2051955 RepID=UPI0025DA6926|nr:major coat protein [Methylobacter sp.]MCK9619163.1 hypothetical protein [Methylobacter sp.]
MKKIKVFSFIAAFVALFGFSIAPAQAALNAAIAPAFTTLNADALELVDLIWPVLISVTIAFIILRLFPKAANKAV